MAAPRSRDYVRIFFVNKVALFFVFVIVAIMMVLWYRLEPRALYAVSTQNGQVAQKRIKSMELPMFSRQALINWSVSAVTSIFTFDANNYQEVIPAAVKRYFIPSGVDQFLKALLLSGQIKQVTAKQLIVSSVVSSSPVILEAGYLQGRYAWKIQMPLLITYQSASQIYQERQYITLLLRRVPTNVSPYGVAIEQFTAQKQ